jgi:hypothetical protein
MSNHETHDARAHDARAHDARAHDALHWGTLFG